MDSIYDILVGLAGIAGVFVGFGALVVLSEDDRAKIAEMHMVRSVVAIGLLTLVGALVPVALSAFGLGERWLWGGSGALFLAMIWFGLLHPTNRPVLATMMRTDVRASIFFWLVLEPLIQVPLVLCVVGLFPAYAPAFYLVAVIINLGQSAQTLLQAVYARIARADEAAKQ